MSTTYDGHTHHDRDTCRALADKHRPEFSELLADGMTIDAIGTLYMARDMLHKGSGPYAIAYGIIDDHRADPFTEADVWPHDKPAHWHTDADLLDAFTSGLTS